MSREERIEAHEETTKERVMTGGMKDNQKGRVNHQPMESHGEEESDSGKERAQRVYLGCLTRDQLLILCAAVGLVLLIVILVTAVVFTSNSGSSGSLPSFPTGGDMLDFLVQKGDISKADGLLATWYHRANNKSEMNKALASDAMILEADITVEGFGTANQKPVPIMAHPPDIYSDNTLDQWLEAVLDSRKGMKLDFKSLASVAPSLDLLNEKNRTRGINRPVWINADVLRGPNADFLPPVNGTRFLQLIQEKFPDVTVSPGWKVIYAPPLFTATYTRSMVEDMYDMIKDVSQKVTFPVHVLLVRSSWQHISWLLSQSPRFSLTLWQGSVHPNVSDLLFIRDNSHPARVYYDIYEPTLSAFKQAARQQGRLRRYYPGGDLMEYFYPTHDSDFNFLSAGADRSSLAIHWFTITDRDSLLAQLSDGAGGMLVVLVDSHSDLPGVPLVEGPGRTSDPLTLQDFLEVVGSRAQGSWGLYLRVRTQELLEASLRLLDSAYSRGQLYRPVWINMEVSHGGSSSSVASTVERLFPYVTLVLTEENWPPRIQATVTGSSQRVAVHLNASLLPNRWEKLRLLLMEMEDKYDVIVEQEGEKETEGYAKSGDEALTVLKALVVAQRRTDTRLYVISDQPLYSWANHE